MVCKQNIVLTCRLPDNSSIFSAEAHAIILCLDFIDRYDFNRFVVFSDSLSCLQAIHNARWSNPLICEILENVTSCQWLGKKYISAGFPAMLIFLEMTEQIVRPGLR